MGEQSEYAREMEKTQQIGRLYFIVSKGGYYREGWGFHIFVLPKGEKVNPNGCSEPLNKDSVLVYGIINVDSYGFETYGWIHEGKWKKDFEKILHKKRKARDLQSMKDYKNSPEGKRKKKEAEKRRRDKEILKDY